MRMRFSFRDWRVAQIAYPWLVMIFTASAVQAQFADCQPVTPNFSVFLSEPAYTTGTFQDQKQLQQFLERLQFELDQEHDARWVKSPSTDVRFVMCFHRAPRLDGQEFVPSVIETMHTRRVLLEIWGNLEAEDGGKKITARMNYLLVPLKFAANRNERVPPALQRLVYSDPGTASKPDFVELIARPLDIDAFVAAAFGFKLLRERQWDIAHQNLCRAATLLKSIQERSPRGRTGEDIQALRTFVVESAGLAIKNAGVDPKYKKPGLLSLYKPNEPCHGEE